MILDKYETVAWCKGTPEIPCWFYGRTTHVRRSDGSYECTRCHTIKELSGMDHGKSSEGNFSTVSMVSNPATD